MSWEYEYKPDGGETVIYWNDEEQGRIDRQLTLFKNGYPQGDARDVIADAIQSSGTPKRIRMQFDLNYGFSERFDEHS